MTVRLALRRLSGLFGDIAAPSAAQEAALQTYSETTFLPALPGATDEVQLVDSYRPAAAAARTLQLVFIAEAALADVQIAVPETAASGLAG